MRKKGRLFGLSAFLVFGLCATGIPGFPGAGPESAVWAAEQSEEATDKEATDKKATDKKATDKEVTDKDATDPESDPESEQFVITGPENDPNIIPVDDEDDSEDEEPVQVEGPGAAFDLVSDEEHQDVADPDNDPVWMYGSTSSEWEEEMAEQITGETEGPRRISAEDTDEEQEVDPAEYEYLVFSEEYMGSDYYQSLLEAKENLGDLPFMEKVLKVGLSQEGYLNYAVMNDDPDTLREKGVLWTGAAQRNTYNGTGNTEYTRWAQRYLLHRPLSLQYLDSDWCAIFASWCLYQAGYYSEQDLRTYYYSYYADPRVEKTEGTWITAFNFDQNKVWYTPSANKKLAAYSEWCEFFNTDVDPYTIGWKPGGMVFFSWDASGVYFDHVAIVMNYDPETHVLTYLNGNSRGMVRASSMDLDAPAYDSSGNRVYKPDGSEAFNSDLLMAYAEYESHDPVVARGGWHKSVNGWWYENEEGWFPTKQWMQIDGNWYYFNEKGYLEQNCYINGYHLTRYGKLEKGVLYHWEKDDKGKWYEDNDGNYLKNTWAKIDGYWYYLKNNGYRASYEWKNGYKFAKNGKYTGSTPHFWVEDENGWKYQDAAGNYVTGGWKKVNGYFYYFRDDGYIAVNEWIDRCWVGDNGAWIWPYRSSWHHAEGGWWFGDSSGWYAKNERLVIDGKVYYFDLNGFLLQDAQEPLSPQTELAAGWHKSARGWWYRTESGGYYHDGWQKINGQFYYFMEDGYLAVNQYIDRCWLDKNGAWTYRVKASWHHAEDGWWFGDSTGWYARNMKLRIDGVLYTFDQRGFLVKEQ